MRLEQGVDLLQAPCRSFEFEETGLVATCRSKSSALAHDDGGLMMVHLRGQSNVLKRLPVHGEFFDLGLDGLSPGRKAVGCRGEEEAKLMKAVTFVLILIFSTGQSVADLVIVNEIVTHFSTDTLPTSESYIVSTITIRGDKHRIDIKAKGLPGNLLNQSTVVDRSTGIVTRLDHSKKTYYRRSSEEVEKSVSFSREMMKKRGLLPDSRPVLRPTGKTGEIRGFRATKYICTRKQGGSTWILTYWLAEEFARLVPVLAQAVDPEGALHNMQFPDPATLVGVPVEVVLYQRGNWFISHTSIKLLSLEEKPVSELAFLVPEDYVERVDQEATD